MRQENYSIYQKDESKQYISEDCPPVPRRIVAAANLFENGVMLVGARHWDSCMHNQADAMNLRDEKLKHEQGFIDQWGQFISREVALKIALKNGQKIDMERNGSRHVLYSEGLY